MVGPWSADGTVVGYLGHPDGATAGTVTAYRRDGALAWSRSAVAGDPGFLPTGWAEYVGSLLMASRFGGEGVMAEALRSPGEYRRS